MIAGLLLAAMASPMSYSCDLVAHDGELVSATIVLDWRNPQRLTVTTQTKTEKWPGTLSLSRATRFGGQYGSNLWEIEQGAKAPQDAIENIWFDTILQGEGVKLIVRDARLPNQIRSPLARGNCTLIGIADLEAKS